jgi:hypothetical protein
LEKQLLALSKEVEQRLAATPIRMFPWTKEEWDRFIELSTYNTNAIEDSKMMQEQQHLLRSGSIDLLELICAKGKLTEKNVEEIRKKIKKVAAKKFLRARVKDASKEDTTQYHGPNTNLK